MPEMTSVQIKIWISGVSTELSSATATIVLTSISLQKRRWFARLQCWMLV